MKAAFFSGRFASRRLRQASSPDAGRITGRATITKVIVHEIDPFGAEAFCYELLFQGLGVDHDKVKLPFAARSRVAPVPAPTWRTLIPVSFSKAVSSTSTIPASIGPMVLDSRINLLPPTLLTMLRRHTAEQDSQTKPCFHQHLLSVGGIKNLRLSLEIIGPMVRPFAETPLNSDLDEV